MQDETYRKPADNHRLCCIVPSHNYGRYIEKAIDSILAQTRPADEVIVIDDASTDDTLDRLSKYHEIKVIKNKTNIDVSASRNRAIATTTAEYIVSIDADDWLRPEYFEVLTKALDDNPSLGVVYTSVDTYNDADHRFYGNGLWPPQFSWSKMAVRSNPPRTMIPSSAMFRREMWRRCGGYIETLNRGEDVAFWLHGISAGFDAKKVDDRSLYVWRRHGLNKSSAGSYPDAHAWLPFLWGDPPPKPPPPRDYSHPMITVVITVGPGHERYAVSAIESVVGQTFLKWKIVVVNDSGSKLDLSRYPFINKLTTPAPGSGASVARNVALGHIATPFVVFLDGDDWLHPFCLQYFAQAWATVGQGYIYSDVWEYSPEASYIRKLSDYNHEILQCYSGITTLLLTEDVRKAGGFDETMKLGGEDVDFYHKLHIAGVCGTHLNFALLYYRVASGTLRRKLRDNKNTVDEIMKLRYDDYKTGGKKMAACCGGDNGQQIVELKQSLLGLPALTLLEPAGPGKLKMQFIGTPVGAVWYLGKYLAGNNDTNRFIDVDLDDVQRLKNTGKFIEITIPEVVEPRFAPILSDDPEDEDADREVVAGSPNQWGGEDVITVNIPRRRGRPKKNV